MFFFTFGGAWLEYFVFRAMKQPVAFAVVGLVTAGLVGFAYQRYRRHRPALAAEIPSVKRRRADRIFHIVNVGQWVVILVAGNVLVNLGLSAWVIPSVIFIVGLHLLPLAYFMEIPPHYVTGLALMAFAAVYPFLADGGPASPIGCLGAGLILWASAGWAMRGKDAPATLLD